MAIFHTLHIVSDDRHVVFYADHQVGSIWVSKLADPTFQAAAADNPPILLSPEALVELAFLVKSFKPKASLCNSFGCRRKPHSGGPHTTIDAQAQQWDAIDAAHAEPAAFAIVQGRRS